MCPPILQASCTCTRSVTLPTSESQHPRAIWNASNDCRAAPAEPATPWQTLPCITTRPTCAPRRWATAPARSLARMCAQTMCSPAPSDNNTQQHMTTFTLGLGARGRMVYSSSYLSDSSGDYFARQTGQYRRLHGNATDLFLASEWHDLQLADSECFWSAGKYR